MHLAARTSPQVFSALICHDLFCLRHGLMLLVVTSKSTNATNATLMYCPPPPLNFLFLFSLNCPHIPLLPQTPCSLFSLITLVSNFISFHFILFYFLFSSSFLVHCGRVNWQLTPAILLYLLPSSTLRTLRGCHNALSSQSWVLEHSVWKTLESVNILLSIGPLVSLTLPQHARRAPRPTESRGHIQSETAIFPPSSPHGDHCSHQSHR